MTTATDVKTLKLTSASPELGNTYKGSETVYSFDPAAKVLHVTHTRLGDKRSSKVNFNLTRSDCQDLAALLNEALAAD